MKTGHRPLAGGRLLAMLCAWSLAACSMGAPRCDDDDAACDHDAARAPGQDAPSRDAATDAAEPDVVLVADAPIVTVSPPGLATLTAFEQLPYLRSDEQLGHDSSFDRAGGNNDWVLPGNYLYDDDAGDKVLLDQVGPGCVYMMWVTGPAADQTLAVYIDGETTPRINQPIGAFFAGTHAPFLAPLVEPNAASSGGFVSYLPLPYARSIRIVTSGAPAGGFYYNFDYHTFPPDTHVVSWTGHEDSTAARALFANVTSDPVAPAGDARVEGTGTLAAGAAQTLLDVDGPREVTSVRVALPDVISFAAGTTSDDGRATRTRSAFTLAVDPGNHGAVLVRRYDASIAGQRANVFVNGAMVGAWAPPDGASGHFRDAVFAIPASFTAGHSSLDVRVDFVSSALDWNEFHYWLYSRMDGADARTDELDVGNAASESSHHYAIDAPTWSGTQSFPYDDTGAQPAPALDALHVRVTWDGAAQPAIDAPLNAFFALGHFGVGRAQALPAGIAPDGTMYFYLPMPFAHHAKVELVNTGAAPVDGVYWEVRHRAFTDAFTNVGNLHVAYNAITPSMMARDLLFVDVEGAGQVVGVVQSELGTPGRGFLEGDARVRVDDSRSPAMHGTGTEDFYNAGWYFQDGPFTLALDGNVAHVPAPGDDSTAMYRFFLGDALPFRRHIRLTIEHGPVDDVASNAWTAAYYYLQPAPRATLTDTLTVGDAASEASHGYAVTGGTFVGSRTYDFEGELEGTMVTATGRAHRGSSQFTLAISPDNHGIILRRLLDQNVGRQRATVWIDGASVGDWYTAASNPHHAWRESDFQVPASFTAGHDRVTVRVQFVSSAVDWNEFVYQAYSLTQ